MPDVSETEIAWLAGLLEGEGSFGMITSHVAGKAYRYPKIVVNMTDRDVIARVAANFGNSVYVMPRPKNRPTHKQQWRAQVSGSAAAEWMRRLYPWLGSRRRARIDEVLTEYAQLVPTAVRRSEACAAAASERRRVGGRFAAEAAR